MNRAYKMFVGGAFVRSESGRYFQVKSHALVKGADPGVLNMPRGSRKDVRDAVLAAKNAEAGWAARTAFNRGQILYRLAEMMESRRDELVTSLVRGGAPAEDAEREVAQSVDRCRLLRGLRRQVPGARIVLEPRRGPAFRLQRPRADGRGRRDASTAPLAARARLDRASRHLRRQYLRRARQRGRSAHAPRVDGVRRDERHAGRRRQRAHRARRRRSRRFSRATAR